ncbi:MAG: hypothetical protein WCC17_18790, partial [Candidatus Nitrosopolaris sp.]
CIAYNTHRITNLTIIIDGFYKAELKRRLLIACKMLILEITEYRTVFSNSAMLLNDGTNILFLNNFLNLDGYNGVLYSGLLSYFGGHTQSLIRRLYERIRLHNEILSDKVPI